MKRSLLSFAMLLVFLFVPRAQAGLVGTDLVGIEADTGILYNISYSESPIVLTPIRATGLVLGSLEFYNGSLYGFTVGGGPALYELNLAGEPLGLPISLDISRAGEGGLVIAPDGTAYGVSAGFSFNPALFHFDLATGLLLDDLVPIEVPSQPGLDAARDINGLAWLPADAPGATPLLLGLDRVSNSLFTIDPVTGGTVLSLTLDPDVGTVGGMTVTPDGQILFATSGLGSANPGTNSLYRFDPGTTDLELIGTFGPTVNGIGISGLAVIPEPATISLLALGGLALLCKRRKRRMTGPCP